MVSNPVVVSVPAGSTTPYRALVDGDGPSNHWTLGEPTGRAARDWRGGADLTLPSAAVRGQASVLAGQAADPAVKFPGTANAYAGTAGAAAAAPATFSVEAWFTAPAGTRGKLLGFGDKATGASANHDRSLYMSDAGKLVFAVRPATTAVAVTSPASYNDGAPHHAVVTFAANDLRLYVDGQLVASRDDVPAARALTGWWRVGGDAVNGLPTPPGVGAWNGVLDEVAVYPAALGASGHHASTTSSAGATRSTSHPPRRSPSPRTTWPSR